MSEEGGTWGIRFRSEEYYVGSTEKTSVHLFFQNFLKFFIGGAVPIRTEMADQILRLRPRPCSTL